MSTSTRYAYTLRPYQQVADTWLEAHPRAIYADATGLGKTPTTAAYLARHLPALVVAPSYLAYNWYLELCEALPDAHINMPEGTRLAKRQELAKPADVRIINYDTLRTATMPKIETVIFDEAHRLRKRDSLHSIAARKLCADTARNALLTGTPYYRADEDVWHLLHCIAPKRFSSYWDFIREWYTVNWYAPYAPKIYGISRKKRAAFEDMLSSYMLMRSYRDVGRVLPPLIENVITFELPQALHREYTALHRKWQLLGEPIESVGTVYYLLRQFTMCSQKVDIVKDIVDSLPARETALIYTWYLESAHTIAARLKRGYQTELPVLLITGETPPTQRARLLADQKRTNQPSIIVATISALQEGQNMEHIRHVIYAEETYVKGEHNQTLARTRRDRGDDAQHDLAPVMAYYVRARKTVDQQIPTIRNSRAHASDRDLVKGLQTDG